MKRGASRPARARRACAACRATASSTAELHERAYDDKPLPIGERRPSRSPTWSALMTETLALAAEASACSRSAPARLPDRGARRAGRDGRTRIERLPALAAAARAALEALGYADRVDVAVGDGTLGWAASAPFDAVIVTAGAPQVPRPLVAQLAPQGGGSCSRSGRRNCRRSCASAGTRTGSTRSTSASAGS